MNRLTKKSGRIYRYNFDTHCDIATRELRSVETHNKIVDKLGQLEDIEEMCEQIHKQPVYKKYFNAIIDKENYTNLYTAYNFSTNCIEIYGYDHQGYDGSIEDTLPVENYGKTWAFSEEELK